MNAPLYTADILRLAGSLEEPRKLERVDGRAERRSLTCGSRVATEVQLDQNHRVIAVSQEVEACAFGQAAAAIASRHVVGRSSVEVNEALAELAGWLAGERTDGGSWPQVEALAPARGRRSRHAAIVLPFECLAAAIKDAAS